MTVVVGTAGHIDHGKTTLLRALTGIDADRLPEEQRRGMTIDVGYAHLALADGDELDFVDVPGHDRLVGNMLVGAGEIDAALLVVALDDGVRAQTIEHLELLDALAIRDGVVALTKLDVLEPDDPREVLVPEEVEALLAPTSLAGSPIVSVSASRGDGLDALRTALEDLRDRVRLRPDGRDAPARLAIDRAFAVRGRGVVVTGTMRGGAFETGQAIRLEPGGAPARIREIQVHGRTVDRVAGAGRVALNLAGVRLDDVRRGLVAIDGAADPGDPRVPVGTERLLVALRPIRPLDRHERLRLHAGTDQVEAIIGRTRREEANLAGGERTALLRLARPTALAVGDRFVLRRPSPPATLAGGVVLDVAPPRGVSRRRLTADRLAALADSVRAGGLGEDERLLVHGALARPRGSAVLAADVHAAVEAAIVQSVAAGASRADPAVALTTIRELGTATIRGLAALPRAHGAEVVDAIVEALVRDGRVVRTPEGIVAADAARADPLAEPMERLERALATAMPPPLREAAADAGCPPAGVRRLEAEGRIVRLEPDLAYAAETFAAIEAAAVDIARDRPLTPAALRDATGTSRRFVVAILEELDRRGVLRRTAEGHVLGPRAPATAP